MKTQWISLGHRNSKWKGPFGDTMLPSPPPCTHPPFSECLYRYTRAFSSPTSQDQSPAYKGVFPGLIGGHSLKCSWPNPKRRQVLTKNNAWNGFRIQTPNWNHPTCTCGFSWYIFEKVGYLYISKGSCTSFNTALFIWLFLIRSKMLRSNRTPRLWQLKCQ